nr:MAG: RNA-dependent RNA polymerase [Botourmiaviridae sp.]
MFTQTLKDISKVEISDEKISRCPSTQLKELRSMLNTFYEVQLPEVPEKIDFKEFCVGLIENPCSHPWKAMWEPLPIEKKFGISHSLFLFRKTLPSKGSKEDAVRAAFKRLTTPSEPVSRNFKEFISKEVKKIFRPGWDRSYKRNVSSLSLSTSACSEVSRRDGGARLLNQSEFHLRGRILANEYLPCDSGAKISAVVDGGKFRVVTSNPVAHHALGPLHYTIYDHLSRQPWLLRGDAKPSAFKGFFTKPGERFCSGDYEAATDNIPLEVYREMLLAVEESSREIGSEVWSLAFRQVQRDLYTAKGMRGWAQRGQLMGSFLSFPFLCLLNYLIFRYSVGEGPVKINGDDIVFRASPGKIENWKRSVGECGLVLSEGKTIVHDSVFTLNSCVFRGFDRHVRSIPFIRSKPFFMGGKDPDALKGRYHAFLVGGDKKKRMVLKALFLKRYRPQIWACQRSLSRCMGWKVNRPILKIAGLWKRERFYLEQPFEPDLPIIRSAWSGTPPGWTQHERRLLGKRVLKERLEDERTYYGGDLVEATWTAVKGKEPGKNLLWARIRFRTLNYIDFGRFDYVCGIKKTPLYKSLVALCKAPEITVRKAKKKVWVWTGD